MPIRMSPEDYDAWYESPRGRWIGEREFALSHRLLRGRPGETLLDVGCGTGWFSRRHAADGLSVTGLDANPESLAYARMRAPGIEWIEGDMRDLPFSDDAFEHVLSVAALCFVPDERAALAEMLRVARRRVVVGWLNRSSLLYWGKVGQGAYAGATWHTQAEIRALFDGLPATGLRFASAVFMPGAGRLARVVERLLPARLPLGAMLFASAEPR